MSADQMYSGLAYKPVNADKIGDILVCGVLQNVLRRVTLGDLQSWMMQMRPASLIASSMSWATKTTVF